MFSTIVTAIASVFTALGRLLEWINAERMKKAGRDEVLSKQQQQAQKDKETADAVEARPTPADKRPILDGLRRNPTD